MATLARCRSIASVAVSAATSALASGTFIYVAVMEVIPKEVQGEKKELKLGFVVAGYGVMALVVAWLV